MTTTTAFFVEVRSPCVAGDLDGCRRLPPRLAVVLTRNLCVLCDESEPTCSIRNEEDKEVDKVEEDKEEKRE